MESDKIDITPIEDDFVESKSTHKSKHYKNNKTKPKQKNFNQKLPFSIHEIVRFLNDEQQPLDLKMKMLNDLLTLPSLIKAQYGKITEWARESMNFNVEQYKQIFNFRNGAHKISNNIYKFKMPVYAPWIEECEKDKQKYLINHADGSGMYRQYSNQFFNLNKSSIPLSILDKWDIDLWLNILTNIPSIQIYDINTINILSALYVELIRSYSITLHKEERTKHDIYKDIKQYINDIYYYMNDNKLLEMDYANYNEWPNNIKIAMDAITEGEVKFYFGSNLFYGIKIHNLIYDSPEEAIKYIIDIVYYADEKRTIANDGVFELENSEVLNNKITKLIYNILQMPKEVDIRLNTYKLFAGNEMILYYNKIHLLSTIFKYIIGFERRFEGPLSKINRFCMLWNVIKSYSTKIICEQRNINNEELKRLNESGDDVVYVYNLIESTQTTLLGLIQIIGYRLLSTLQNTIDKAMNSRQISIMEEFINTPINNINNIDFIFKLNNEHRIWLNYIKGIDIHNIPYKLNYTPIKLYRERSKNGLIHYDDLKGPLTMNVGFKTVLTKLIDMKTPDVMGFPFN